MRHRFDDPVVHIKGVLQQLFAVTGHGSRRKLQIRPLLIQRKQVFPENRNRVAGVAAVDAVQYLAVTAHDNRLDRCGTRVNAQIDRPLISHEISAGCLTGAVAGKESVILCLVLKQRVNAAEVATDTVFFDALQRSIQIGLNLAAESRTQRHKVQAVFRTKPFGVQRRVESMAKPL